VTAVSLIDITLQDRRVAASIDFYDLIVDDFGRYSCYAQLS